MLKKIKIGIFYLAILLTTVMATPSLFAVKAFFNPNPPPTVYNYGNPQGNSLYTPPTYLPPTYLPPTTVPPLYNPPSGYWQNTYPQSFYYIDPNGNLLWSHPIR